MLEVSINFWLKLKFLQIYFRRTGIVINIFIVKTNLIFASSQIHCDEKHLNKFVE